VTTAAAYQKTIRVQESFAFILAGRIVTLPPVLPVVTLNGVKGRLLRQTISQGSLVGSDRRADRFPQPHGAPSGRALPAQLSLTEH
jgi:hypothetical protein